MWMPQSFLIQGCLPSASMQVSNFYTSKHYIMIKRRILSLSWMAIGILILPGCSKHFDKISTSPSHKTLVDSKWRAGYSSFIQGVYSYVTTARNLGAQSKNILFSRGDETSSGSDYAAFGQNSVHPDYYSLKETYQYMYTVAGQAA